MLQILTAPQALKTAHTYRYFVDLASKELDSEGYPVDDQTVDVVVAEPTDAAIREVLAEAEWLAGYEIRFYWTPDIDEGNCF